MRLNIIVQAYLWCGSISVIRCIYVSVSCSRPLGIFTDGLFEHIAFVSIEVLIVCAGSAIEVFPRSVKYCAYLCVCVYVSTYDREYIVRMRVCVQAPRRYVMHVYACMSCVQP
jgi:hypothetical protein